MKLSLRDQFDINISKLLITVIFMLVIIIIIFLLFPENNVQEISSAPVAKKGFLDLSEWDFQKEGIVNLRGEWEFYNKLLLEPKDFLEKPLLKQDFFFKVPGIVNNYRSEIDPGKGFFTYRVNLKLPETGIDNLALKFPRTSGTAIKVWLNNKQVLEEGQIGKTKTKMEAGWMPGIVSFNLDRAELEIIVQASNFYHHKSGLADEILLGTESQIRRKREIGLVFDLLLFGSLLIMAFYHLGLFIHRPQDLSPLYFALFCLIINLRMAVTGEAFLLDFFNLPYKFIYNMLLAYYLAVPIFCSFIANMFEKEFSSNFLRASRVLGIAFYIFVLLMPTEIASYTFPYEIITLFFSIYCLYIIVLALYRKRNGAFLFLLGFLFLLLFIINDILYSNRIINTGYYFYLGLFIFILFQSLVLSKRLMGAFSRIEKLSNELQKKNEVLVKMDEFKDKFIASTSEEFKLPVNNIISAAESIIHSGTDYLEQSLKNKLSFIIRTGKGLNYRLSGFVDYLKFKDQSRELNLEKIELNEIVKYILNFFKPFVVNKNFNFKNKIKAKELMIEVDKNILIQVFYNILEDITRFIENGTIILIAEKISNKVEISIKVKAENIFFKYQNNDVNRERGQFITDKIDIKQNMTIKLLELLNGELSINKKRNKLLIFKLTLPGSKYTDYYEEEKLLERKEESKPIVEKEIKTNQKKIIMMISDKNVDDNLIKDIIDKDNYGIKVLKDKNKVADNLDNDLVLVIIDYFKLDRSILKLCEKIRERFKTFELPILMIISRSNPETLIKGFKVGINDIIKKPFEISQLKAKIRTLVNLKERVAESFQREQDFLRAQIKPHFLYNTLNTIAYLCEEKPEKAHDLIIDFAHYLRYSFEFESLNQIISIKKELELVKFYVNIQKERFNNKIKVKYDIEKNLSTWIPPLIIQPLVENAIKHGILKKKDKGTVEIKIRKEDSYIIIIINDDGVGMTETEVNKIFESNKNQEISIGLKNVNKRLKRLYNQELKIISNKYEGTTVKFKIPIINN